MSRRILLATMGSLGDLHPFIAIALQLKAHGYEPLLATNPHFRDNVEAAGIRFHPVRPSRADLTRETGLEVPQLGRLVMRDMFALMDRAVYPFLQASYEDVRCALDGTALVLTSALSFAARFAADKVGIPRMAVALQPMNLVSIYDPPAVDPAPWSAAILRRLGPLATRAVYDPAKWLISQRAGALHRFRREIGLPASRVNPVYEGQFSEHGTLAMYSPLLGSMQPDYPPHTQITGFAFYDGERVLPASESSSLAAFLDAGPAPLVFTLGSFAIEFADDFFEIAARVSRTLRERALFIADTATVERFRSRESRALHICDYARYSEVFPRARVIVHQGGIGTTAQALRAGKPQLIVSFLADQPDNAARLQRLGVARSLPRTRYRTDRLLAELTALLTRPAYVQRSGEVGVIVAREDGASRAAQFVDRFFAGTSA